MEPQKQTRLCPDRSIEQYSSYMHYLTNNKIAKCSLNVQMYQKVKKRCLEHSHQNEKQTICAILYDKRGKIVSEGFNSYQKTHPIQQKFNNNQHKVFLHAEICAILVAVRKTKSDDLSTLNLVICRVCKDGEDAQAFPCDGCIRALKHYGINGVTYFDGKYGICSVQLEE